MLDADDDINLVRPVHFLSFWSIRASNLLSYSLQPVPITAFTPPFTRTSVEHRFYDPLQVSDTHLRRRGNTSSEGGCAYQLDRKPTIAGV